MERTLRCEVGDGVWHYLIDKGYVEDYLGGGDINSLADEARGLLDLRGEPVPGEHNPPKTVPKRRKKPSGATDIDREVALSLLLAQLASEDKRVLTFRAEVLGGKLVPESSTESWILSQGAREGRVEDRYDAAELWFPSPAEDSRNCMPVAKGGVLDRLRILSEHLERRFGWDPAQATKFVLTDSSPLVSEIVADFKRRREIPVTSRVELSIDPAATPRQVAEYYRLVRKRIVKARPRRQDRKHLELAVFAASRPKRESAATSKARWNRLYPEWSYDSKTNFLRDCKVARERLLSPGHLGG